VAHPIAPHLFGNTIPVCPIRKGRPLARAWGKIFGFSVLGFAAAHPRLYSIAPSGGSHAEWI